MHIITFDSLVLVVLMFALGRRQQTVITPSAAIFVSAFVDNKI
jgi:hypothetical protein